LAWHRRIGTVKKSAALLILMAMIASLHFVLATNPRITYLSENFETWPNGWTIGNNGTVYPKQTTEHVHSGSYASVWNTSGTGYAYAYKTFPLGGIGGNYHMSVWIYFQPSQLENDTIILQTYNATSAKANCISSLYVNSSGNYIANRNSSGWDTPIFSIQSGFFHHIEVWINRTSGLIDYWNDGYFMYAAQNCSNVGPTYFYYGDTSAMDGWNNGKVFYDDLTVDDASEGPIDTSPPVYTTISTNSTEPSSVCLLACNWTDNVAVWKWIFGTNLTGPWVNDSTVTVANLTSVWANVTKTLNGTVGNYGFEWWCEDNSSNWANTGIQILLDGIIDYWSETHYDPSSSYGIYAIHPSTTGDRSDVGEVFTCLSTTHNVSLVKFYCKKVGSVTTGTLYAVLYALTGTAPHMVPTGSPLATSNGYDVSGLTTSFQLISFTFNSSQNYIMDANTTTPHYGINLQGPTTGILDDSNNIRVGYDDLSGLNPSNSFSYVGTWNYGDGSDVCFYVYGSQVIQTKFTFYGNVLITFTPRSSGSSWTFPLRGYPNLAFSIGSSGTRTSAIFGGNALLNFQVYGTPLIQTLAKNIVLYGSAILNFFVNGYTNLPEIPIDLVYAFMAIVVAPAVTGGYLVMRRRRKRSESSENEARE
jgi:hypothetical protein